MELSIGTRLRLQRERRQVSLAAISAETKIKLSLLEGLERDDVSHWPEGIFRRAHVRAYARAIGVDPDEVVREFVELHPDSVEMLPAGSVAWPERNAEGSPHSSTRLGRLVTSIAAVPTRLHPNAQSPRVGDPGLQRADNSETAAVGMPGPARDVPDRAEEPARREISLSAAADLCTRLARAQDMRDLTAVLEDAAGIVDAVGLILWSWDARATALRPLLTHGYPDAVLARFPAIPLDAENAVAAAFRSGELSAVSGGDGLTGAVAVPLMVPSGCVGVLALEFQQRREQHPLVRDFATILAAPLATLFGSAALEGSARRLAAGATA